MREWDMSAIDAKVTEVRRELFNLKMQKVASGLKKTHQLNDLKKTIARLLTVKTAKGVK